MSPVFGHGRLRLYLLKLLEESPRHGYEVIRLLQDRFMGVYSPSPGTIYPRLARLEEEGLVTHELVKGKKVYTLTDQGRAELVRRMDELAELEEEITASAQSFAREVQEDVRHTVRSLREELTQAAREMREHAREAGRQAQRQAKDASREASMQAKEAARQAKEAGRAARREPVDGASDAWRESKDAWQGNSEVWRETMERQKEEWRRQREHWKEQQRAWKEEWRHTWEDVWKTAVGSPEEAVNLRLERTLRQFVEEVRQTAARTDLNAERVAAAKALLRETADRLRTEVFHDRPE